MPAVTVEHAPELIDRVDALFVGAEPGQVLGFDGEVPDDEGITPFAETITERSGLDMATQAVWKLERHDFMVENPDGSLGDERYARLYEASDPEAFWVLNLDTGELESSEEVVPYSFGQAARFASKLAIIEHFDSEA